MYKNISVISVLFVAFSLVQFIFASLVYVERIGFTYLSFLEYFGKNESLISWIFIGKVLSPHLMAQIAIVFIFSHLLQFSKKYTVKKIQLVIYGLFFFSFLNIMAIPFIRFYGEGFFILKAMGFLGFMFFYFVSSFMIVKSFVFSPQVKIFASAKK